MIADRDGRRITLRRIHGTPHRQRPQDEGAEARQRDDVRIRRHGSRTLLRARAASADDPVAFGCECCDRNVPAKGDAARCREARQLLGEAARVARFVGARVDAAFKALAGGGESGLDSDALVDCLHLAVDALLAHQRSRLCAVVEFARLRVELEDSALLLIVLDAGRGTQRLQAIARIEREVEALDRVAPRTPRQAFAQEGERKSPLMRIGAQAEQQRRILAPQPLQDFSRCAGVRPWLRRARRRSDRRSRTRFREPDPAADRRP